MLARALGHAAALALVALAPRAGAAAEERRFEGPVEVVADEVEFQAEREVYVARGHVRITQQQGTLTADRVIFSTRTQLGVATGHVVMRDGGDALEADFVQFSVEDLTGVVFRGRLASTESQFKMSGAEVRKTGERTYEFEQGRFTSCRCPDPDARDPWVLTAGSAKLEVEGYARARNTTLEILGVPVLWAPYVIYPLKRERQTGLLFPEIGVSNRNGFELGLPFFWAARENVNVTLTPQYLTKRGFKPSGDVEYVFGERGEGELYGTWIHDREVDSDTVETPFGKDRWGGQWRHLQDGPAGTWLAADANAISDNEVPFDFDDFDLYRADRFLHSRALAGTWMGPSDAFGLAGGVAVSDDLQNPNDQDRDELLLQRLPEVAWSAPAGSVPGIPGLVASTTVEYVDFRAVDEVADAYGRSLRVDDLFYDIGIDAVPDGEERDRAGNQIPVGAGDAHNDDGNTEGDGEFQEGEPLADRGHRLAAHPRLAYPVRLADRIELYPEVGWYGTFYEADRSGAASRNLFTGRLDLRSQLRGDLALPFDLGTARHLVEPHASWVLMTHPGEDDNALFVPRAAVPQDRLRQLELDNVLLDPADRLEQVNSIVFGVDNRLIGSRLAGIVAEFDFSAEYRAAEAEWSLAVLQGMTRLPRGWRARFHTSYALDAAEVADGLFDLGWSHPAGHGLGFRYRYIRDIPQFFEDFARDNQRFDDFAEGFLHVNQLAASGRAQVTPQWALTYLGAYSFENTLSLVNQFGVEYTSRCRCWAVRLQVDNNRVTGTEWSLSYTLLGLGKDNLSPFGGPGGRRDPFDGLGGL